MHFGGWGANRGLAVYDLSQMHAKQGAQLLLRVRLYQCFMDSQGARPPTHASGPRNAVGKGKTGGGFGPRCTEHCPSLQIDLVSAYFARLINRMKAMGQEIVVPTPAAHIRRRDFNFSGFSSGYVARSIAFLPGQGTEWPWLLRQNYLLDWLSLSRWGEWWMGDSGLRFSMAGRRNKGD